MEDISKTAGVNCSAMQKSTMIEMVQNHPELMSGKFSDTFSKADSRRLWQSFADTLNKIQGSKKTWDKWRKCYHDSKNQAKKKAASIASHKRQTGGGPSCSSQLTSVEEAVLAQMPNSQVFGHSIDEVEIPYDPEDTKIEFLETDASEVAACVFPITPKFKRSFDDDGDEDNPASKSRRVGGEGAAAAGNPPVARSVKSQLRSATRLDKSLDYARCMAEDCTVRKRYYEEKLAIMRQQAATEAKKADAQASASIALQAIAASLELLVGERITGLRA